MRSEFVLFFFSFSFLAASPCMCLRFVVPLRFYFSGLLFGVAEFFGFFDLLAPCCTAYAWLAPSRGWSWPAEYGSTLGTSDFDGPVGSVVACPLLPSLSAYRGGRGTQTTKSVGSLLRDALRV